MLGDNNFFVDLDVLDQENIKKRLDGLETNDFNVTNEVKVIILDIY